MSDGIIPHQMEIRDALKTLANIFINIWFLWFIYWFLLLMAVSVPGSDVSDILEIIGVGNWIISISVISLGLMISYKFWRDTWHKD